MIRFLVAAGGADSSSSLLSDPTFWAVAGVAVAIIAIVISVIVAISARERKSLAYGVSAIPLVHDLAYGQIEISYGGEAVKDVSFVELEIGNVGNTAIRSADFERPLLARFGPTATVLSAEVVATQPLARRSDYCAISLLPRSRPVWPLFLSANSPHRSSEGSAVAPAQGLGDKYGWSTSSTLCPLISVMTTWK